MNIGADPGAPDGTDPAAYRWLAALDRAGWAWEWLRRDPAYVAHAHAHALPGRAGMTPLLEEAPDPSRGLLFR